MSVLDLENNALIWENWTWKLFIATDYDWVVFPEWNGSNQSTSIASIEADYVFADVWYFEKFVPMIKKWDEKVISSDYCNAWDISIKTEKVTWFKVGVQEILEMTNLALILGSTLQTVTPATWIKGQQIIWMKRAYKTNPFQLFKFVSCPDALWLSNIFYFVKATLSSDINMPYMNLAKEDFVWVELEFDVSKAWNFFIKKETAVAL